MPEPLPSPLPPPEPSDVRLDSWKEIANYLNRDITTVQRWEKREAMPVHRHLHDRKGSVYASRTELDAWAQSRQLSSVEERPVEQLSPAATSGLAPRRSWFLFIALLLMTAMAAGVVLWLRRAEYFWHDPLSGAHFQALTDWDGVEQAAAISRDGHLVAFLSNRNEHTDVWITQVGSGEFHNLTNGGAPDLVNPSVRNLSFLPDGSLVTFWTRKREATNQNGISIWAAPTLGGQARPYLEGVAEYDWSPDVRLLAYHTPGPGDPLFVTKGEVDTSAKPIFSAAAGLHSHFPLWSADGKFVYVVEGSLPDKLDIWRVPSGGGTAERITTQNTNIGHPAWLDRRTLLYLATNPDGSGPSVYSIDVERRIPHRLTPGLDRYTSLSASGDSHRLVLTRANPKKTLWRFQTNASVQPPTAIPLTTSSGFSPRLGPDYIAYISAAGGTDSLWKLVKGASTELWRGPDTHILGSPAISADGRHIAISVQQNHSTRLVVLESDGTNATVVCDSLELQGDPAWAPDMQSITTAANDQGVPHLFRVPINGTAPSLFVKDYSLDPSWAGNEFMLYSGPDIGTKLSLKAANPDGSSHPLPELNLPRGTRHVAFLPSEHSVVVLRKELHHSDLWLVNLETGAQRQLTHLPPDFDVVDFDASPDGREIILERVQDRSDIVLLELRP